jgi:hypothetical protein
MEEPNPKDANSGALRLVLSAVEFMGGAAFLGAWTLAVGGGYFAEYLHVFAIPVSVTSAAALGALPMLAALALVFIAVMAVYVLLPSLPLWAKLDREGRCLLDGHKPSGAGRASNPFKSPDLYRRWASVHASFAVTLAGLIVLGALVPWVNDSRLFAVTLVGAMVASVAAFEPARRRVAVKGASAAYFYGLMTFSIWVQSGLFILVLRTVLSLVPDSTAKSLWAGIVAFLWIGCMIPLVQFAFAIRIRAGLTGDMLKGAVLTILVLAAVPLAAPPVAARVMAVALQKKDKDGQPCVVLVPSSRAELRDWAVVSADPAHMPAGSSPLLFASLIDTTWYVKRTLDGQTYAIPKEQVSTFEGCPPTSPSVPPVKQATVSASAPTSSQQREWPYLGGAALVVSLLSLAFAIRAHNTVHRPLVTARITSHRGGNLAIALNILVENTGNRPAFDVLVRASRDDVMAAMVAANRPVPEDVERVLFGPASIPVLANGRTTTNSFAWLGTESPWKAGVLLPIVVEYRGLDGRRYCEKSSLLLADDAGFARGSWGDAAAQ